MQMWEHDEKAHRIKEIATKFVMNFGFDSYRMSFLEFFRLGVNFSFDLDDGKNIEFLTSALLPFIQRSSPTNAQET